MNTNWISLYFIFDELGFVSSDSPDQDASLLMITNGRILYINGSQFAKNADCRFYLISFDLWISEF